jgi:MFS family permease
MSGRRSIVNAPSADRAAATILSPDSTSEIHMPAELRKLTADERRQALRLAIGNAVLWSMGNGLTTGSLIIYLAQELGARGRQLGLILALQSLVGILRFAAPSVISALGGVKKTALLLFLASYVLLCGLPLVALESFPAERRLPFFVVLLSVHQLLEGLATVALWAWLGQLVPPRIRGRYFAARQRWQLAALIPTLVAAGLFADWWRSDPAAFDTLEAALIGYVAPIALGAVLLLASVLPLWWMPAGATPTAADRLGPTGNWRSAWRNLAPLVDGRFGRLLLFGCWISFFNGITQSAAGMYPKRVLALGLLPMMLLPVGMRLGQIALAPWVGRFSDRFGNRPTIFVCQAAVAFGPLFYLSATPERPEWLAGAFVVWSAYVGLNVCLPNLTLKLTRDGNYAAYAAAYFALSGLAYGVGTLLGGWLVDLFAYDTFYVGRWRFDQYQYLFYIGWMTRLIGLLFIFGIDEPGAWSWRRILRRGGTTLGAAEPTISTTKLTEG